MISLLNKIRNNDNGEVMLESVIIVTFTLIMLMALLALGFLFYQKAMINSLAVELADGIADSYKYTQRDEAGFTVNDISDENINSIKKYRTTFAIVSMQKSYKKVVDTYIDERSSLSNLGLSDSKPVVENVKIKFNNAGRLRIEVSVSHETETFLSDILEYVGVLDSTPKFTATASAEVLDITAYVNHIKFYQYIAKEINETDKNGNLKTITQAVQKARELVDKLWG